MYELWETDQTDGCVQKLSLLGVFNSCFAATAAAVNCRRPWIEVLRLGCEFPVWLSHTCNADGSWHRAFGPVDR